MKNRVLSTTTCHLVTIAALELYYSTSVSLSSTPVGEFGSADPSYDGNRHSKTLYYDESRHFLYLYDVN
jgi:hypothetical protein